MVFLIQKLFLNLQILFRVKILPLKSGLGFVGRRVPPPKDMWWISQFLWYDLKIFFVKTWVISLIWPTRIFGRYIYAPAEFTSAWKKVAKKQHFQSTCHEFRKNSQNFLKHFLVIILTLLYKKIWFFNQTIDFWAQNCFFSWNFSKILLKNSTFSLPVMIFAKMIKNLKKNFWRLF